MQSYTPWQPEIAKALIDERRAMPGAVIPILHALQDCFGYVDKAAVPMIAEALNLTRAEVHGVITFYHDFRSAPPGRHVVKVCRAESCQSMGCDSLIAHIENKVGATLKHTAADGSVTLEPVYCLGNCALSPALMWNGELHGRMTSQKFDRLHKSKVGGR
ncbi:MAG: formate dehydrogenase subunit gamma [Alphaproteobacteria bacterium]